MKNLIILLGWIVMSMNVQSQLKTSPICPPFSVDVLDGKVNGLECISTVNQVKEKLPCFTSAEAESSTATCGGGVFYKDRDIYFYTARDYVELGPKFTGKLSLPLMGASRTNLFKWLGLPKIKDVTWDAFTTAYGTLILYYNKLNKVNKIQFSTKSTEALNLCE
jgi:hypothetical protein